MEKKVRMSENWFIDSISFVKTYHPTKEELAHLNPNLVKTLTKGRVEVNVI